MLINMFVQQGSVPFLLSKKSILMTYFPRNSPADIFEDHDNKNNNDNSVDDGKDITDDDNSGVQV